jgi:hypothetical protein
VQVFISSRVHTSTDSRDSFEIQMESGNQSIALIESIPWFFYMPSVKHWYMQRSPGFLISKPLGRWKHWKCLWKIPRVLPRIEPGTSGVTVSGLTNWAIAPPNCPNSSIPALNSSIPHLNTVESHLGYVACFLNLSFDVLSVICSLHNIWSLFKIPFYLVPPIVFSFRVNAYFLLGDHMPLFVEWHLRVTLKVPE